MRLDQYCLNTVQRKYPVLIVSYACPKNIDIAAKENQLARLHELQSCALRRVLRRRSMNRRRASIRLLRTPAAQATLWWWRAISIKARPTFARALLGINSVGVVAALALKKARGAEG